MTVQRVAIVKTAVASCYMVTLQGIYCMLATRPVKYTYWTLINDVRMKPGLLLKHYRCFPPWVLVQDHLHLSKSFVRP